MLLVVCALGDLGPHSVRDDEGVRWGLALQMAVLGVGGLQVLALAALDLWRRRSPESLLLALWIGGIFVFAAYLNWSTSARALIPAAPAAAILALRRMGDHPARCGVAVRWAGVVWHPRLLWPLAPGLAVALAVGWADARLAESAHTAASELSRRYGSREGQLWFQGAWGFHYYMEAAGAKRVDFGGAILEPGDLLVVAVNNATLSAPPPSAVTYVETAIFPGARWIATMATPLGAGFHSGNWGPLPFAVGDAPDESYLVLEVQRPIRVGDGRRELDDGLRNTKNSERRLNQLSRTDFHSSAPASRVYSPSGGEGIRTVNGAR